MHTLLCERFPCALMVQQAFAALWGKLACPCPLPCTLCSLQRVGSILFAASIWVLPTVAPALYLRWRKEALILYRVGFFAFPLLRKAAGALPACAVPRHRGGGDHCCRCMLPPPVWRPGSVPLQQGSRGPCCHPVQAFRLC